MKNNIRQFWNNLPSSKRKELINMEKDNVLKRLRKYEELYNKTKIISNFLALYFLFY